MIHQPTTRGEVREHLDRKLKRLSEELWEGRCRYPDIEQWLSNFRGDHANDVDTERLHAMHLLASFTYFGERELRALVRSMYRDYFSYPIIQRIRTRLNRTKDTEQVQRVHDEEVRATRFLPLGSSAESSAHILYWFRQENEIAPGLFDLGAPSGKAKDGPLPATRIVFIDDLCGSGSQAVRYGKRGVATAREMVGQSCECICLFLFATEVGIAKVYAAGVFDSVQAVSILDASYRTYDVKSRIFRRPPPYISRETSRLVAEGYGMEIYPGGPLGWDDGQLLIGFHHNTPNNTLPILWWRSDDHNWKPAFPRHGKGA